MFGAEHVTCKRVNGCRDGLARHVLAVSCMLRKEMRFSSNDVGKTACMQAR